MKRELSTGAFLSAVFVDYDNIYLSLKRKNEEAAKRFAKDAGLWVKAIETGSLITATNGMLGDGTRRIVMNRCYGNPIPRRNQNDNSTDMNSFPFTRHHFLRAGFEIIDCPPLTAQLKNSSDIRMVMDVRDYLTHATYFDEFVILSGDADFTPVLHRLRAHARRTVIYANDHTAAPYTAICDGEIREADLIKLLIEGKVRSEPEVAQLRVEAPAIIPETARQEIMADVIAAVRSSQTPVPLEALADRAVRQIGHDKTIGTGWGGAGGFRELLVQELPEGLRLSGEPPYVVIDTTRHIVGQPPQPRLQVQQQGAQVKAQPQQVQVAAPIAVAAQGVSPAPQQGPDYIDADAAFDGYRASTAPQPITPAARHPAPRQIMAQHHIAQTSQIQHQKMQPQQAQQQPMQAQGQLVQQAPREAPSVRAPQVAAHYQQATAPRVQKQAPIQPQSGTVAQPTAVPRSRFSDTAAQQVVVPAAPPPPQQPAQAYATASPQPQPLPPQQAVSRTGEPASSIHQSIARIHEACQAPPLAPPEYRMLFETMAQEINENGLIGAQTIANIAQRAQERGMDVRRDDVRFVLEVVSEADPWFEQGASANLFAGRFRNFVVARCRGQGLNLSADELDLVEAWFAGSGAQQRPVQDGPNVAHVSVQPAPTMQPSPVSRTATQPQHQAPQQAQTERNWSLEDGRKHVAEQRQDSQNAEGHADDFPRIVRTRLRG